MSKMLEKLSMWRSFKTQIESIPNRIRILITRKCLMLVTIPPEISQQHLRTSRERFYSFFFPNRQWEFRNSRDEWNSKVERNSWTSIILFLKCDTYLNLTSISCELINLAVESITPPNRPRPLRPPLPPIMSNDFRYMKYIAPGKNAKKYIHHNRTIRNLVLQFSIHSPIKIIVGIKLDTALSSISSL